MPFIAALSLDPFDKRLIRRPKNANDETGEAANMEGAANENIKH